ncbi:MAG: hypothetical protein QF726_07865 [Alphaproteobacteria bacterium]|nr:hypothetical protein [Alphaproteobacteria bacterium]HJM60159.1 hypothetical protein [Alphaproteobacteria bacterium]
MSTNFFWAAGSRHDGLRPVVFAAACDRDFPSTFDWTETRDATVWLTLPAALVDWRRIDTPAARA